MISTIISLFGTGAAVFVCAFKSLLDNLLKIAIRIIVILAILILVSPLLPADPFRSVISGIASAWSGYGILINWIFPVDYIVDCFLFRFACSSYFYVYKFLMKSMGTDMFSGGGSNVSGYLE